MNWFTAIRLFCAVALCLGAIALGSALRLPAVTAEGYQQYVLPMITHTCASASPCLAESNAKSGSGIEGISSGGHGSIGQTKFKSTSANNGKAGVLGQDVSTTGAFDSGVLGTSVNGYGVQGTSVNGYGMSAVSKNQSALFVENSGIADGIHSIALNNDGTNSSTQNKSTLGQGRSGVWGHDDSTDGGGFNVGVAGSSTNGTGVQGTSTNNIGVGGVSTNFIAVTGDSQNHVGMWATSGTSVALVAQVKDNDTSPAIQVYGGKVNDPSTFSFETFDNNDTSMFFLDNAGNAILRGQVFTAGSCQNGCSSIHHSPGNRVVSYSPRESIPTMEDVGIAQLVNGQAVVRIDAAFANVIDTHATYMVFLTPEGQSHGLYVAHKLANAFTVAENDGGHSTIAFDYRIVAKPFGVNAARLPILDAAHMPLARPFSNHPASVHH